MIRRIAILLVAGTGTGLALGGENGPRALIDRTQGLSHSSDLSGPENEPDALGPRQELGSFLLRHTPADSDRRRLA